MSCELPNACQEPLPSPSLMKTLDLTLDPVGGRPKPNRKGRALIGVTSETPGPDGEATSQRACLAERRSPTGSLPRKQRRFSGLVRSDREPCGFEGAFDLGEELERARRQGGRGCQTLREREGTESDTFDVKRRDRKTERFPFADERRQHRLIGRRPQKVQELVDLRESGLTSVVGSAFSSHAENLSVASADSFRLQRPLILRMVGAAVNVDPINVSDSILP